MISRAERIVNHVVLALMSVRRALPGRLVRLHGAQPEPQRAARPACTRSWANFVTAWNARRFGSAMLASAVITVGAVARPAVLAILSGYAFGVLGVAGRRCSSRSSCSA